MRASIGLHDSVLQAHFIQQIRCILAQSRGPGYTQARPHHTTICLLCSLSMMMLMRWRIMHNTSTKLHS